MAYTIMLLPLTQISHTICSVAFPVFSSIEEKKSRVAYYYLMVLKTIAIITFPVMAGVAILAPVAIPWVLGEKWQPAVLPIQILAALGCLQALYTTVGTIFRSQGRTGLELKTFLFITPAIITSFVIGVHWGVVGVCVAYSVCMLLVTPVILSIVLNLVESRLGDMFRAIQTPALCSGIMAIILFVFRLAWSYAGISSQDTVFILLALPLGGGAYILCLMLTSRQDVRTLWKLVRQIFDVATGRAAWE